MFTIPGTAPTPSDQESMAPYLVESSEPQHIEAAEDFAAWESKMEGHWGNENKTTTTTKSVETTVEAKASSPEQLRQVIEQTAAWVVYARTEELNRSWFEDKQHQTEPEKGSIFERALSLVTGAATTGRRAFKPLTERTLINRESSLDRELFGPIPADHRREFFCLDKHTWVWHEEWKDADSGQQKVMTTRYEVHPNGILKVQEGRRYTFIEGQELQNLAIASQMYYERVMRELYKRDPRTGQPLPPSLIQ